MNNRHVSTSYSFTLFLLISMTALSVVILATLWEQLNSTLNEQNHHARKAQSVRLIEQMESYLEARLKELSSQSLQPILIQAVMQPELNRGRLEDQFNTLRLQHQHYPMALLNFANEAIIERSTHQPHAQLSASQWASFETAPVPQVLVNTAAQKTGFILISPIFYNGLMEGALTATIPADELLEAIQTHHKVEQIELIFSHAQQPAFRLGATLDTPSKPLNHPLYGLSISYRIDPEPAQQAVTALLLWLALLMGFITVIIATIATVIGRDRFVRPLEQVSNDLLALEQTEHPQLLTLDSNNLELNLLVERFNDLLTQTRRREAQLRTAYDDLQRSKDSLVHSEKMASIGTMAAGVAHEINNPMAFISSNISSLEEYLNDIQQWQQAAHRCLATLAPTQQQAEIQSLLAAYQQQGFDELFEDSQLIMQDCNEGLTRITDIVRSLKTFSHSGEDRDASFSIRQCIETSINLVRNEVKNRSRLDVKVPQDYPCKGALNQISQVLVNLLVNAAHAIDQHGLIQVEVDRPDQMVRIRVTDNGKGIPEAQLQQIFDPFFTTKPVGSGTGLGLSISFNIIQQHGGSISAASVEGQGTTFTLRLPIAEDPKLRDDAPPAAEGLTAMPPLQ